MTTRGFDAVAHARAMRAQGLGGYCAWRNSKGGVAGRKLR